VDKAAARLEAGLRTLQTQIRSGRERSRERAERRIGRLLERYSRAGRLFQVRVRESGGPSILSRVASVDSYFLELAVTCPFSSRASTII